MNDHNAVQIASVFKFVKVYGILVVLDDKERTAPAIVSLGLERLFIGFAGVGTTVGHRSLFCIDFLDFLESKHQYIYRNYL